MRNHRHPTDDTLAGMFHKASRLMARAYHYGDHAQHAQHRVMSIIMDQGGTMPQGELLEILDVRSSSLSELLGKLERQGLVERQRSEKDKRSFEVSATEEAKAAYDNPTTAPSDGSHFFACLDQAEQEQLRGLLEKIINTFAEESGPEIRGHGFERGCGRGQNRGKGDGFFGLGRGNLGGKGRGGQ